MGMTLREHRLSLADAGGEKYSYEIEKTPSRLVVTLRPHLSKAGYKSISGAQHEDALSRILRMLFDAQDQRPMFHVEGTELPLCWNAPKDWTKPYIKYEWGHMLSRNQNATDAHKIENLALYSARCNQHIQTSLDIQELMLYGGVIATRISQVLSSRRRLFASPDWKACVAQLGEPMP